MSEQRLSDLAMLSMERDQSDQISFNEVIHRFEGTDRNRTMYCRNYFFVHYYKLNFQQHYYYRISSNTTPWRYNVWKGAKGGVLLEHGVLF